MTDNVKKIFARVTKEEVYNKLLPYYDDFTPDIVSDIHSILVVSHGDVEMRDYFVRRRVLIDDSSTFHVSYTPRYTPDFFEDSGYYFNKEDAERFITQGLGISCMPIEEVEAWLDGNSVSSMVRWLFTEKGIDHMPSGARRPIEKFFTYAVQDLEEELHNVIVRSFGLAFDLVEEQ